MDDNELNSALDELKKDKAKYNLVFALADSDSTEAALRSIGRSKGWFYGLPKEDQDRIVTLAAELNAHARMRARQILEDAIIQAAAVKVNGLTSRNEKIKQDSATEILDRAFGKPNQPLTGKDGGPIVINWDDTDSG